MLSCWEEPRYRSTGLHSNDDDAQARDHEEPTVRSISYLSSARELWAQPQLDELLGAARAWNHPRGVTGMLLYSGGNFIQAIEGPHAAMAETFARINADPRHHNMIVMLDEEIAQRSFPDWTMGYHRVSAHDAGLEGHSDFLRSKTTAGTADGASAQLQLLNSFRAGTR